MPKSSAWPVTFSLDPLPEGFVISKPLQQEAYDCEEVDLLERAGTLIKTRKRDGWKLIVVKNKGRAVKIYTDGLIDVTDKLEHIAYDLRRFVIPDKTILVGEGVFDEKGKDNFLRASSCMAVNRKKHRSIPDEICNLKLILFDALMVNGEPVCRTKSYSSRLSYLEALVAMCGWRNSIRRMRCHWIPKTEKSRFIFKVEELHMSLGEAKRLSNENDWEGLVLYNRDFHSDFRLDGKAPQRIRGCFKWKPIWEDDFVVRKWNRCDDDPGRLKDVNLLQVDPKTKKEFDCGKLGGFSEEMRYKIMTARKPLVLQVKFEMRFPSGKLRNARLVRMRRDKRIKDCIAPTSYDSPK